ncbi:MAG: acetolactate decarboxylase, partial [Cyclobacteriaceae bacterium]
MIRSLFILSLIFLLSCTEERREVPVSNIGELRQIMHQGAFQARVNLDTLVQEGTFGLGALDSLSGEVLVLNGTVYRSEIIGDSLVSTVNTLTNATLFVYSSVNSWDTISASGISDLENLLVKKSSESGLAEPFPFIVLGKPNLTYHVINFDPINGDFSKHKEGSYTSTLSDTDALILGFYSTIAKGVYTHHDSNMHLHVI